MAKLPTFADLRRNFPYKKLADAAPGALVKGNKELVQYIGGQLEKRLSAIYPDLDLMNTCAIRLSYCLNQSGFPIRQMGGVRTIMGGDNKLYTISADEMIAYMKAKFGAGKKVWDGRKQSNQRWLNAVKVPTQGMFAYDWQGRIADFGATGHVDIGKLTGSSTSPYISEVGTKSYFIEGAMIVHMWETS